MILFENSLLDDREYAGWTETATLEAITMVSYTKFLCFVFFHKSVVITILKVLTIRGLSIEASIACGQVRHALLISCWQLRMDQERHSVMRNSHELHWDLCGLLDLALRCLKDWLRQPTFVCQSSDLIATLPVLEVESVHRRVTPRWIVRNLELLSHLSHVEFSHLRVRTLQGRFVLRVQEFSCIGRCHAIRVLELDDFALRSHTFVTRMAVTAGKSLLQVVVHIGNQELSVLLIVTQIFGISHLERLLR